MIWESQPEEPRVPAPEVAAATGSAGPAQASNGPIDYDAIRKQAQLTLRASLRDPEPTVRAQGCDALGKIQDLSSVTALIELTEADPDDEVRGRAADALATMGAPVARRFAKLESTAPPLLKVSYALALARLGDKAAPERLLEYARGKDLSASFKAGLALAEVIRPGNPAAISALKALAVREAELAKLAPHAQTEILTRMAALRDANARKLLYALLEDKQEGARLAVATGLAKLGDDAGRKVLHEVVAHRASPSWLVAVLALIPLGEPGDLDLITAKLADNNPEIRRLAARALGDLGDRRGLPALLSHANDPDGSVRVAVAAAILAISGLDPWLLSQASVDWVKSALVSPDRVEREAAAGVLSDIPEKVALRLLARASADPDPGVRRAVAASASKLRSAEAAAVVAVAMKTERDPVVQEQQVTALGEIGSPAVRETLAQVSEQPGRLGVLAAGSLIAVGDLAGSAKLEAAIASPQVELRLAAVQAASASKNPIVLPTLKIGVLDRVFDVRFTAAEGLSFFKAEEQLAVPVLTEALESENAGVVGRALAALIRFGKTLVAKVQPPADMLDSPDPERRLATVPVVRALRLAEGMPLLRRLVADPDRSVRHAGVEAIEHIAARAPAQAIELYKPLVYDADPVVRAKASGQLARLLPPMRPPPDPLLEVKKALDDAIAAAAEAKARAETFEGIAGDIARKIASEGPVGQVQALMANLDETEGKLAAAAAKAEIASQIASDAAGPSPSIDAAKLVGEAKVLAQGALGAAISARRKRAEIAQKVLIYITLDVLVLLDGAAASIATGDLLDAKQRLDRAASLPRASKTKQPGLDYGYAQLYDRMSARTQDPEAQLKLLEQAVEAYQRFLKSGTGPQIALANERIAEISDELKERKRP